jgi:hypothetical protein
MDGVIGDANTDGGGGCDKDEWLIG